MLIKFSVCGSCQFHFLLVLVSSCVCSFPIILIISFKMALRLSFNLFLKGSPIRLTANTSTYLQHRCHATHCVTNPRAVFVEGLCFTNQLPPEKVAMFCQYTIQAKSATCCSDVFLSYLRLFN